MMRAEEVHARLHQSWPEVLVRLGVSEAALKNKHGPCPGCGGEDRFRFDHARCGKGSFYCNRFGAGDGFKLLEHVHGWAFAEARRRVMAAAGLSDASALQAVAAMSTRTLASEKPPVAEPSARVYRIRHDSCAIGDCDDAMDYLESRGLWPLPNGCSLRAHSTVEYWAGEPCRRIGRYPAIVADVVDISGNLVTSHITYLKWGRKYPGDEPRKLLSGMAGRVGCAVRLVPFVGDTLGIAEGIETALSATIIDGIPVWAALTTSLLAKFEPPPGLACLRVYGDRDIPGLEAALRLTERLQGRLRLETRLPASPAKDWNDVLISRRGAPGR